MTIIRKFWLDALLFVGLIVTPFIRDLVGSVLTGAPLSGEIITVRSGIEAIFMAAIAVGLSWFRHRQQWVVNANRQLGEEVTRRTEEIRITQHTAIEALAALCEYNDTDTGDHIRRIREYVRLLGEWMRRYSSYADYLSCRPEYVSELATASMLHDIGKTAIPAHILSKQGPLTAVEYDIMKTHTTVAGELFLKANQEFIEKTGRDSYLALARDIAFYHHERWDGGGYPKGLAREDIPLCARIVAIADVYDALTSRRPYKEPWSHEDAAKEIVSGAGTQFDPSVVQAFRAQLRDFEVISLSMRPADTPVAGVSPKETLAPIDRPRHQVPPPSPSKRPRTMKNTDSQSVGA